MDLEKDFDTYLAATSYAIAFPYPHLKLKQIW